MFMFLPENSKVSNLNLFLMMKKGANACEQGDKNLEMWTNDR